MSDSARLKKFIQLKIFDDRRPYDENAIEQELVAIEDGDFARTRGDGPESHSIYVQVFENMINTVDHSESNLLTPKEWNILETIRKLPYSSRYCLARMLLLKPNHWYPVKTLTRWEREVGPGNLQAAFDALCKPVEELKSSSSTPLEKEVKEDTAPSAPAAGPEVIDLTSDDEDVKPDVRSLDAEPAPVAEPESRQPEKPLLKKDEERIQEILDYNPDNDDLSFYCEDESSMSLKQLLERMTVEQLKQLAKQNKVSPRSNSKKEHYVESLMNNAKTQSTINFQLKPAGKGKKKAADARPSFQTQLPFAPKVKTGPIQTILPFGKAGPTKSQQDRLRKQVLDILGKCYRINYDFFKLVRRLHIIAFRSTDFPDKLMLPALLTRFKKRKYPSYRCERDRDIWSSRTQFLEYEKALQLEAKVGEILEEEAAAHAKETDPKTRATPAPKRQASEETPRKTPTTRRKSAVAETPMREDPEAEYVPDDDEEPVDSKPLSLNVKKAKRLANLLDFWLVDTWKIQLEMKGDKDRPPSLQRFESGYVYTRLLRRSLQSLGAIQEYEKELEITELLLKQTAWQRGKRAKLYDRRALIQTRYLCNANDGLHKLDVLQEALEGVKQALLDDETHLVARPGLMRRLRRLEKQLKIPPEDCARCEGELRKAEIVIVKAKRIHHRETSLLLDTSGNVLNKGSTPKVDSYFNTGASDAVVQPLKENEAEQKKPSLRRKGKSVWEGRRDKQGRPQEVDVEERALQHYQNEGYRGFHAETSIMTTIWVLLNWDIIFADVRGAFETPYQSAPLDIVDDSFYYSRKALFDKRFEEIEEGKAAEIIARHDTLYRAQDTWAIGVRWDICQLPDLIEIVECLGGKSLAIISRLFCEDYVGRSSGGPDLIVWNYDKRICKFVEVKGPGDTPQENQKLWFDSLLGANIQVEICKVEDINDVKAQSSTRKGRGGKTPASSVPRKRKQSAKKGKKSVSEDEEEVDYDQLDRGSDNEDDELPWPDSNKRSAKRRKTDPGPLARSSMAEPTPSRPASS